MESKVDLFDSTYGNFETEVFARIRKKTFGEDFGQNSWTTAEEYRHWAEWLGLGENSHALEVASGSGGPAFFLSELYGCRVTGIDINDHGISVAADRAAARGFSGRLNFLLVNADAPLPFPDQCFDAIVCIDSANHFPHRLQVLKEWYRVLKSGGKAIFTDPVVVTGLVSNEELAARSSVGYFLFSPPGVNEGLVKEARFELDRTEDVTENAGAISGRWYEARAQDRDALLEIEGQQRFAGLQDFFSTVHRLTRERRLSRLAYLMRKEGAPLSA